MLPSTDALAYGMVTTYLNCFAVFPQSLRSCLLLILRTVRSRLFNSCAGNRPHHFGSLWLTTTVHRLFVVLPCVPHSRVMSLNVALCTAVMFKTDGLMRTQEPSCHSKRKRIRLFLAATIECHSSTNSLRNSVRGMCAARCWRRPMQPRDCWLLLKYTAALCLPTMTVQRNFPDIFISRSATLLLMVM